MQSLDQTLVAVRSFVVLLHSRLIQHIRQADTAERLRLVLAWVINYAHVSALWRANHVSREIGRGGIELGIRIIYPALDGIVLVDVLDAHQLILLVTSTKGGPTPIVVHFFFICVSRRARSSCFPTEIEELDKSVVRYLLWCIAELFSLHLDIVVLIIFVVPVVRLHLYGLSFGIRIKIVHVGEAHVSEAILLATALVSLSIAVFIQILVLFLLRHAHVTHFHS